jgi:hypothetical protein
MPNKVGRPRAIDDTVITQLSAYLREGCSVLVACRQSCISSTTYYEELARNSEFADIMRASQEIMDTMAMKQVYHAIGRGDLATSKWWISRQDKREGNALRAHDYRQHKQLTVSETQQQVRGSRTVLEPITQQPVSFENYEATQQRISVEMATQ